MTPSKEGTLIAPQSEHLSLQVAVLPFGVNMKYQRRVVDEELESQLSATGAVLLKGPKAVGKTETASQYAKSTVHLDIDKSARQLEALDAELLLQGPMPRLIDEWQIEPNLWNQVRREVDKRQLPGQFILTGSATPPDDATRHTGAGRFSRIRMRPMSLFETKHSERCARISTKSRVPTSNK